VAKDLLHVNFREIAYKPESPEVRKLKTLEYKLD
jgi:hypothetical protein